jgi:hypothetical protein
MMKPETWYAVIPLKSIMPQLGPQAPPVTKKHFRTAYIMEMQQVPQNKKNTQS